MVPKPRVTSWLSCGGIAPACVFLPLLLQRRTAAQCAEPPDGPGLRLLSPRPISSGLRLTAAAHQPQESPLTRLIGECFWIFSGRGAAGEMRKRPTRHHPRVLFYAPLLLNYGIVKADPTSSGGFGDLLTGWEVQTVVRLYGQRDPRGKILGKNTASVLRVDATASLWQRR